MTEVELREGGPPKLIHVDDDVGDALAASEVVSAFRLGGGQWEVAANTKVGVAAISGVTVWIKPKVDIRRILFLLGYAKNPGWRDDTVALSKVTDLVPALADAFADQAERALERGLVQGYVEVNDSLTVLRGRLRDQDQLRRRYGIAVPLLVRFDDYTSDIAENQLLRAAAELLLRLPGVASRTRARLRGIRQDLADVTLHVRGTPLPTWTPTRLNARYHVALWLAELILRGNAVDQAPGDVRLGGFLVDMAKVFEDFLIAALTEAFRPYGGWSRAQDRHHLDIDDLVAIRPDLVWYQDAEPAAVIDASTRPRSQPASQTPTCTRCSRTAPPSVWATGTWSTRRATHRRWYTPSDGSASRSMRTLSISTHRPRSCSGKSTSSPGASQRR